MEYHSDQEKKSAKVKYYTGVKAEILKGLILRGMKGEKLKTLINENMIKGEKNMIKKMMISKTKLARFKLWAVRVTTIVLMWAIVMQFKALCESFGPKIMLSKSYNFPPPSKSCQ